MGNCVGVVNGKRMYRLHKLPGHYEVTMGAKWPVVIAWYDKSIPLITALEWFERLVAAYEEVTTNRPRRTP